MLAAPTRTVSSASFMSSSRQSLLQRCGPSPMPLRQKKQTTFNEALSSKGPSPDQEEKLEELSRSSSAPARRHPLVVTSGNMPRYDKGHDRDAWGYQKITFASQPSNVWSSHGPWLPWLHVP